MKYATQRENARYMPSPDSVFFANLGATDNLSKEMLTYLKTLATIPASINPTGDTIGTGVVKNQAV
jgi:hypothetical protein